MRGASQTLHILAKPKPSNIAPSGDFWTYTVVDKGDIVSKTTEEEEDVEWEPDANELHLHHLPWSDVRYGSREIVNRW
jgi:hypothetical protein